MIVNISETNTETSQSKVSNSNSKIVQFNLSSDSNIFEKINAEKLDLTRVTKLKIKSKFFQEKKEESPVVKEEKSEKCKNAGKFVFLFFLKILFCVFITCVCWGPVTLLHLFYPKENCIICGEDTMYNYKFKIKPCNRVTYWIFTQAFWSTYIPAFFHIYEFYYLADNKRSSKKMIISFFALLIIHYLLPLVVYWESGRSFPLNIVPFIFAILLGFLSVVTSENYKGMIKFMIGLLIFYSSLILIFFFPIIMPFFKEKFGRFFPFSVSIALFMTTFLIRTGIKILYSHHFIQIDHLFNTMICGEFCIEIFKFVYFIKAEITWVFYLNNVFNLFGDVSEDLGFLNYLIEKIHCKNGKCWMFIKRHLFCKSSQASNEESKKIIDVFSYIISERFTFKMIILLYYYLTDKVGLVVHPENKEMDSCRFDWKFRSTVNIEEFRIGIYFVFTLFTRYIIVFLVKCFFGIKRYKFYLKFSVRSLIVYAGVVFLTLHYVFQITFVFM